MLKQLLCALCAILPLTAFAQSEELWGYSYDSEFSTAGSGGGDMGIAMWVPGDGELSGASITALNLPFASSDITNLSIWAVPAIEYAAASLPQKVYEQRVSGTMKGNAYNRVELSKPLEIPAEGFFIGYSFHTDYYYPICTAPGTAKDGLWVHDALFGRWYDYPELGVSAMQLFVTGMQLDTHKVDVLQAQTRKCEKGKQTKATITLVSNSQKPVESIGFNITVDDQIQPVTAILPQPIPSGVNQVGEVAVTFTAPQKAGTYEGRASLTSINGEPYSGGSACSFYLDVRDKIYQRLTLIEEFTGTWCGNCPRGWLSLERVREKQSDQALVVGIHQYNTTDPMYCPDYADLPWDGAPSAMIDRKAINIDPYYGEISGGFSKTVDKYSDIEPTATINVAGTWADNVHGSVNATAEVTFLEDSPGSRIAFVLTADSITGTSSAWRQNNSFYDTDPMGMGDLAIFCRGGELGEGFIFLTYNDVMCGSTWRQQSKDVIVDGGAALAPTGKGNTATATGVVTINVSSAMRQAMDFNKIYLTAIVLNADGTVANAARCRVGSPEGLSSTPVCTASQTTTYDLTGRSIQKQAKGLYIQNGKKILR